jgi:diaminopimelate decarboxylase
MSIRAPRWSVIIRAFDEAFAGIPHQVCYAVKANSNLAVLNVLARLGSGIRHCFRRGIGACAGGRGRCRQSGVFRPWASRRRKSPGRWQWGIACFNVESEAELERINTVAVRLGKTAPVSLRVNPNVDAQTHPYISTGLKENKFGIDIDAAVDVYLRASRLPGCALSALTATSVHS